MRLLKSILNPTKKRYQHLRDLLLLSLLAIGILSYQQRHMISGQAPPLKAISIQGKPLTLANDAPTLIYFWGSWCPVCRVTSPMVDSIAKDANVIAIAVDSGSDQEIYHYLETHGLQFDVINDIGTIHQSWGVQVFPAIYVVDKQGEIRFKTSGVTSSWGLKIRLLLATI